MFADFRRTFKPTKEERKQDLELFLKMHTDNIGKCCTCIHKIESHAPGFVVDDGSCDVKSPVFFKKVWADGKEPECPQYEEDTEYPKTLKQQIELLDVEYPPIVNRFPQKDTYELTNLEIPSAPDEMFAPLKNMIHKVTEEYFGMIRGKLLEYGLSDNSDYSRVSTVCYPVQHDGVEHPYIDYYVDEQFKFRVYATVKENFDNDNLRCSYTMNYRIEEEEE